MDNLIEEMVNSGISVTIEKGTEGIYYDVNTEAKSYLHLYPQGGGVYTAKMRYDREETIEDFDDLCLAVKSCLHGRDYMNQCWLDVLVQEGYLERVVETKVSYR